MSANNGVFSFLVLQFVEDSYDGSYHPAHVLLSFLAVKKMSNQLITTVDREEKVRIPFSSRFVSSFCRNDYRCISLIGVYDGIICLANEGGVILYSPSIRESQKLPFHHFEYPTASYFGSYVFGIWFESNKPGNMKHYKVFRVVTLWNHLFEGTGGKIESFKTVFEIYDSAESTWRESEVTGIPPFGLRDRGLLCNGIFHMYIGGDSVFTLDPSSEVSGLLSLPFELVSHMKCPLFVLGGSLAWFSKTNETTDIWIMTEYGVKESWTKQYTFQVDDALLSRGECVWHPLAHWNCMDENELLLELSPDQLVSFNLLTKKVTEVPLRKLHPIMTIVPYMETLSSF